MLKKTLQVDGAAAVVDPRLGEFKEQFMLPVGSVIPKYVGRWGQDVLGYLETCAEDSSFFQERETS